MPTAYLPELDISPLLQGDDITFYQSQISILRWMVELGRVDIHINVSLLSSYLTAPQQGHMEAVYSIYGYLKSHTRSTMVFDDTYLQWGDADFTSYDWTEFYRDAKEDIPVNTPQPRGMPVPMNVFVDASHARNKVTRRSQTGILLYLNRAPTIWYSKTQKTVETSTFGAEFLALHIAAELIKSIPSQQRLPVGCQVDTDSYF